MKRKSETLGDPPAKRPKAQWTHINSSNHLEREITVNVDRMNPKEIKLAEDPSALDLSHVKLRDRPDVQEAKLPMYVVKRCGCRIGKECAGCLIRNAHCVVDGCTQEAKSEFYSPFFQDSNNNYRVCKVHRLQFVHDVCKRLMFFNPVDKKLYCVACKQVPVGVIGEYLVDDMCDLCEVNRAYHRPNGEPLGVCSGCMCKLIAGRLMDHPTCDQCTDNAVYTLDQYAITRLMCAKHCDDSKSATLLLKQTV